MANLFELHNVSYAYETKTVLSDLSFSLQSGLFYGLAGPNGSGKTTMLDLLLGNKEPASGWIKFNGRQLRTYRCRELAKKIALVPQEFKINFDFTVQEVVMMGRHPHIPRFANPDLTDLQIVEQVMTELGISELKDRLLIQLSGGEKQRVIVARTLAQSTPVLILDEATASLDIHHSIKILRTIKNLVQNRGGTVIAAIHDLNLAAAYCDAIIMLNKGRKIKIGPTDETLTPELINKIFGVASRPYFDDFSGVRQVAFKY